jgi:DNA-binding MarR family transcriptional regulator
MIAYATIPFDSRTVKPHHRATAHAARGETVTEPVQPQAPPSRAELFPDDRLATTATLLETNTLVAAAIDRLAVHPAGLDPATADLLVRLAKSPTCGIRGVEIGEHCQMTATRVSRLVDRAEAEGLVRRDPDPTDRRAQHVVLTERGREAASRLAPLMDQALDALVFETLSAEERATFMALLARLRDRARELLTTD